MRSAPAANASRGSWVGLSIAGSVVAQMGLLIVLGRSLPPVEFGLAAALIAFVTLPRMLVESVLAAPIIQRPELTLRTPRNAATLAAGASVVAGVAPAVAAGAVEMAFGLDAMGRWVRSWPSPSRSTDWRRCLRG